MMMRLRSQVFPSTVVIKVCILPGLVFVSALASHSLGSKPILVIYQLCVLEPGISPKSSHTKSYLMIQPMSWP